MKIIAKILGILAVVLGCLALVHIYRWEIYELTGVLLVFFGAFLFLD